ncbi:MAG: D-alanine--D-alanine ligase [Mogibacterium sp.]|nr:D-alanine--D-alanine ligase [Mogibacterium sp.]
MKIRIAMLWGGKTVEHEVSVISGIQALMAMDTEKYECIPVYMTKDNDMYIGSKVGQIEAYRDIPELLKESTRVVMINDDGRFKLVQYPNKAFGGMQPVEFDMAFPVVHGTNVEDGALQGYLKTIGVPFVGPDVTSSAISMDKYITKAVLKEAGVPVLDAKVYTLADYSETETMLDDIEKVVGYPVIVKPVNLGSSVGIGVAKDRNELIEVVDDAFMYATRVMAEHAISNLKEINCAVLGDENEAIASECEEPLGSGQILSYEDKYVSGGGGKSGAAKGAAGSKGSAGSGMANLSRKIPADISAEKREEIRELAVKSFKALGCNGVSRIDFMIDMDNDELYFNEINPIPGSLSFYLWEPAGVPYTELLDRMVQLALARARSEEAITYKFDTNILSTANLGGSKGSKTG